MISRISLRCAMFAVALLLVAGTANASSVQLYGTYWDAGDSGTMTGFGSRVTLGDRFGLDLGVTAFTEGDDFNFFNEEGHLVSADALKSTVFDVGFRYTFVERFYVGGGVSYFKFDSDLGSLDNEVGLYVLGGAAFGSEHWKFFVEGMYRAAEPTWDYNDLTDLKLIDVDVSGLVASVGVMFQW